MPYTKLGEYLCYTKTALTQKPMILIMSTLIGGLITLIVGAFNSLAALLVVNVSFLLIYILLALFDWITGIIASRIEKQEFKSSKLFRKIFLIGFSLFIIFIPQALLINFATYPAGTGALLEGLLSIITFALECLKVGLILALIIYELTSLRENFLRMRLDSFVKIVDIVLVPINKLNDYIVKKFDKVLETDIENTNISNGKIKEEEYATE